MVIVYTIVRDPLDILGTFVGNFADIRTILASITVFGIIG